MVCLDKTKHYNKVTDTIHLRYTEHNFNYKIFFLLKVLDTNDPNDPLTHTTKQWNLYRVELSGSDG